tara:strand:+ start:1345 stop:1749 length:405 start_codon:yes stop_codon:yes gene_type:complete
MKKKNLFDLLALRETVSSNKYIQKLKPLKEERLKIMKILDQLNVLKENKNSNKDLSGWQLKSASNIQKKIFDQISLAQTRIKNLNIEINFLEKKFLDHEIRKKRSLDKSALINKSSLLENEKKADDELQNLRKA